MARSGNAKPNDDDRDYVAAAARRYGLTRRMEAAARMHFEDVHEDEAAEALGIAVGTYRARIRVVYLKMDAHSKAQFVKKVYEAWIDEKLSALPTDSS